ncbi:zinc transport system permease protein [Lachnospiraceae bacterium XBB1006]|nr:zinc transport system permease protein [Lachnospiraceae bacterium XBB1006]
MTFLNYDFMKHAFVAILIIAPLFGMLGTMIVSKKMAFFSDALGHSALTGIAIGIVFGVQNANLSMMVFAVVFALLLNEISRKVMAANDTIISVFSSASLAVGLAILSKGGNFSKYSALLVGDILSISVKELWFLGGMFALTFVFWIFLSNQLLAISLNKTLARSRHMPIRLLEDAFAVLVSLVVMMSIKWVGILIINAMLILPAAAAANCSQNVREYHFFAVVYALFSGVLGLWSSYYTNVATGPMIVIVSALIYFGTYFYAKRYQ